MLTELSQISNAYELRVQLDYLMYNNIILWLNESFIETLNFPRKIKNNQHGDVDDSIAEWPIKTVFS